jgi:hypothetical protein
MVELYNEIGLKSLSNIKLSFLIQDAWANRFDRLFLI